MSLARRFLEKFDPETQKEVEKWKKGVPSYSDMTQISKEYWNKAKEIVQKKYPGKEDYWVNFFNTLDDLLARSH